MDEAAPRHQKVPRHLRHQVPGMCEINQKLINNSNQMAQVLTTNATLKDEIQTTNKRLDGLVERFDILIKCLPQETQTNIENSNPKMDTDPQEE